MKKSVLFAFAFILLLTSFAYAESFYGNVVEVIDGNNIVVSHDSRQSVIRLEGIDCPELSQDCGEQAKEFVSDMVLGRRVWVDVIRKDYHSRLMSFVKIEDKNVSKELINAGLAWYCAKFYKYPEIAKAESLVRSMKIGIWTAENPISPQAFRRESLGIRPNHVPGKVQIGGNSGGYGFSPQYSGFAFNSQPREYGQRSANRGFAYSSQPREYGQSSSNRGFAYSSQPREYGQSSSNRGFAYSSQPREYGQSSNYRGFAYSCQPSDQGWKARTNFGYGIKEASWPTAGFRSVVSGAPGSSGPGASSPGSRGPCVGSPYTPSR